jgi:hypothetical protein
MLKESDAVRTLAGARASIIFFESSIVRLNENTHITIKELKDELGNRKIGIHQDSGRLWSTILKLSGVDEYEVETPTTVAAIRGTSFDSWMREDGPVIISVSHGRISVASTVLQAGERVVKAQAGLAAGSRVVVDPARPEELIVEPLVIDGWIRENIRLDEAFIAQVSPDEARPKPAEEQQAGPAPVPGTAETVTVPSQPEPVAPAQAAAEEPPAGSAPSGSTQPAKAPGNETAPTSVQQPVAPRPLTAENIQTAPSTTSDASLR